VHRGSNASVDVVLLSADDEIFETTRNAIDESHRIWRAQAADEALERLVSGRCGVLVIDLGTVTHEPAAFVRQVTRQFPDLVVVTAGRQADESSLASLISDGSVYRFMHKPLSPKRAGMFLNAAIRSHAERRQHPGLVDLLLPGVHESPERGGRRTWYAAATGILVLVVALAAYVLQRDETPGTEAGTPAVELARPEGAGIPPQILLARAEAAVAAGRLEAPAQDSALDLYRDVLLAQPQNAQAREGLSRVADQLLTRAHRESLAGRGEEARRLVRRVLGADPANPLALAMQARLETPELIQAAEARTEEPTEGFMTLLRREFTAATRRTPRPATAAAAPRATVAATRTAPGATSGAAAALAPPVSAETAAAAVTAAGATNVAEAPVATEAPADSAGGGPSIVPLRELSRVSMSQPDYPDAARRTGTEGWVRLEFTVNERGRVNDIVVVDADPPGVFDNAASSALSRWRFVPPASGEPARTSVLLRFELEE
jgi:protein TonB